MASGPIMKKVSSDGVLPKTVGLEFFSEEKLPTSSNSVKENGGASSTRSNNDGGEILEYSGWVYHLGVNSIGHEYCYFCFLLVCGNYVETYKRDPPEYPPFANPDPLPRRSSLAGKNRTPSPVAPYSQNLPSASPARRRSLPVSPPPPALRVCKGIDGLATQFSQGIRKWLVWFVSDDACCEKENVGYLRLLPPRRNGRKMRREWLHDLHWARLTQIGPRKIILAQ